MAGFVSVGRRPLPLNPLETRVPYSHPGETLLSLNLQVAGSENLHIEQASWDILMPLKSGNHYPTDMQ